MAKKAPSADELSFTPASWKKITPFVSSKNQAGESSKVSFAIDADIARSIDNLITRGLPAGIPYKNRGDFARDACYKWLQLTEEMTNPGATDKNPIYALQAVVQREAADAAARLALETSLDLITANFLLYVQEAAYDQIIIELDSWVRHIARLEQDNPYWFRRWRRKLLETKAVADAVQLVEKYVSDELPFLLILRQWEESIRG